MGPLLECSYQHNTLTFDAHGAHVLLMREQDVLSSPMICNAELHAIINNEKINSLVSCCLIPPSLYFTVCVSEVSKVRSFYAISSCKSLLKNIPIKQNYVSDKDNEQLQLLLCDIFLDNFPSRISLERTITHGIDLLPSSKLVS